MATNALFIEEHVTCPMCLEIFDEPYSLQCRHILCLTCLNRLKNKGSSGRLECPECRAEMPFKRIKRDFKMATLAEGFKKEKEAESNDRRIPDRQPGECEAFEIPGKAIPCWCKTCDQYICQSCELAHKGLNVTKNHIIQSVSEIIAALQVQGRAKNVVEKSNEDLVKVEQCISDLTDSIAWINTLEDTQMDEIDARIDELKNQLENRRTQLKSELLENYEYIFQTLTQTKKLFENYKSLLESSMDSLTQLSTSNDLEALMAPTAMPTLDDFSKQSQKIEDDVCQLEYDLQDSLFVKVINGPDCNVNAYVYVSRRNASYVDLMKVKIIQQKFSKNHDDNDIEKMCMVNDELWCCYDDKIRIFNKNCNLEREITHSKIRNARGLTLVPNGDVILACYSGGLQQFNSQGEYLHMISDGRFCDVCYYDQWLYAYAANEEGDCKVHVFEKNPDSQWVKKSEWVVVDGIGENTEAKMHVNKFGVFITSSSNSRIYIFNHEGDLRRKAGRSSVERQQNSAGFLQSPILCGVDSDGIALTSDYGNNRFQLYDYNQRKWKIVGTLQDIEKPTYALLHCNDLFVSTSAGLTKYKLIY